MVDLSSTKTDEELVHLSLQDKHFFGELIVRYEKKLARYVARRAVTSLEDREDLLQDIFLKVYVNLRGFDLSLSFSSWIYRIAHNEIISWYRKQKVRPSDPASALMRDTDDTTVSIFEKLASESDVISEQWNRELTVHFQDMLRALPDTYQDILVLRFFEEKDYDEISDILQIPAGTVATRLHRAKKKLAALMEKFI